MNKKFIYEYWSKTELGIRMIKSNHVSDSDLLFLIPNNKKKMHDLPLSRMSKKRKTKQKKRRKTHIMFFGCFDIIEEIIEEQICSKWYNNEFFDKFVDIKDISIGEPVYYMDESAEEYNNTFNEMINSRRYGFRNEVNYG